MPPKTKASAPAPKAKPAAKRITPPQIDAIEWSEQTVKVSELKPYERNPRRISKDAYEHLKRSLQQNGYHQRIIANQDLRVIGGHQRIQALKELGFKSVKVLTPSRELTLDEFKRILVQDNLPFGEFDFDILSADFERDQLVEFGMPESWIPDLSPTDEDDQPKLDEKGEEDEIEPQIIHCPKCNHEFSIMTNKKDDDA